MPSKEAHKDLWAEIEAMAASDELPSGEELGAHPPLALPVL